MFDVSVARLKLFEESSHVVACTEKKSAAATESKSSDEDLMIYPL
jgi:hypothetical protein